MRAYRGVVFGALALHLRAGENPVQKQVFWAVENRLQRLSCGAQKARRNLANPGGRSRPPDTSFS
jgi:hypothetical protein